MKFKHKRLLNELTLAEKKYITGAGGCCNDSAKTGAFVEAYGIVASEPPYFYSAYVNCRYPDHFNYTIKGTMGKGDWIDCNQETESIYDCWCKTLPCCTS